MPTTLAHDSSIVLAQDFAAELHALKQIREGRQTFRYATFGDEAFWGGTLGLHQAIAGAANGGVGAGREPEAALARRAQGRRRRAAALASCARCARGTVNLDDPAVTLALLQADAVVGVTGFFDERDELASVGIQCALCHSTVDDSFAPGIGRRLDGWANRDLNVGAIIALAPRSAAGRRAARRRRRDRAHGAEQLGPGKFDAELFLDGKAFRPDGRSAATLIPPAFGLAGVNLHTWTGWGSRHALERVRRQPRDARQGHVLRSAPRRRGAFPIAARERFGHVRADDGSDHAASSPRCSSISSRCRRRRRRAAASTRPPRRAAQTLFNGKAQCATCHVPPLFTEPGWNMHTPEEIGIDDFQAERSPDRRYRTAPLRGLWTHRKAASITTAASRRSPQ